MNHVAFANGPLVYHAHRILITFLCSNAILREWLAVSKISDRYTMLGLPGPYLPSPQVCDSAILVNMIQESNF